MADRTQAPTADQSLREQLDRLTSERLECWLEVAEKRTTIATLQHRVSELELAAKDHPSTLTKLTGEVEYWADRCGAAEQDRDEQRDRAEFIEAAFAAGEDRGDRLRDEAQHW